MKRFALRFHNHLDYIDFVVDSGTSDRIQKLDRLQGKVIRRIEYCFGKNHRKEIDVLQGEFNIEPLSLRGKRNLVKIVHKTSKNTVNVDISRPGIDLRSKPKVKLKNNFTSLTNVYITVLCIEESDDGISFLLCCKRRKIR